ncbi:MAG: hypothetical protein QM589_06535 [Thermomicrobiales bacterium]
MNQDFTPGSRADEERLRTYGDALVDGIAPLPADDLEAVMRQLHDTLPPIRAASDDTPMPSATKAAIWEDIMHQVSLAPATPAIRPATDRRLQPNAASTPAQTRRREWSATASLSVMLALVVGLVGVFVALRFDPLSPQDPSDGAALFAQPTAISLPDSCTPNPEYHSTIDLSTTSLSDLPQPLYTPVTPVSYEQGLAIQQTYFNYLACSWLNLSETPPAVWPTPDANMQTFLTDRMRIYWNDVHAAPTYQEDIRAYICRPVADELLESFPLPVNQPVTAALQNVKPDHQNAQPIFLPTDVYQLPDDRFGVMMGSISTASLRNPDVLTGSDWLSFVAFVEQDGHYYVDEDIVVLGTGDPIIDPPPSATPRTEITYHRRVDPGCASDSGTPIPTGTPASGA